MQQVATPESVTRAIQQLESEGQKVTGRAVMSLTGGSLGTVLQLIKAHREEARRPAPAASEIPNHFQSAVCRLIGEVRQSVADELREQIEDARAGEQQAIEAITATEVEISQLTEKLAEAKARAERERAAADQATALATQQIENLSRTIDALEIERRQLIEAGEAARTEAGKAQLHVERSDQAAVKAEALAERQAAELSELRKALAAAEQRAAVADQRATDQTERSAELAAEVKELRAKLDAQASEVKELLRAGKRPQTI